jgi:hypothetical protein
MVSPVFIIEHTCQICDRVNPIMRWTDHHGIAACCKCGAPYRVFHYDENKQRIDKEPQLMLKPAWIDTIKKYFDETGRNCAPGAFNFPGSSYEVATQGDFDSIDNWMEVHKDELPKE